MTVQPCPVPKCPDTTADPLCEFHTARVVKVLAELPGLYGQLVDALVPSQRAATDDDRITTSTIDAPAPIDVAARALCEDMVATTTYAEVGYRRSKDWTPRGDRLPPHIRVRHTADGRRRLGRESVALAEACRFLTTHLDGVLALDVTLGLEVMRLHRSGRAVLGLTKLVHRLPAPCPYCDHMALERADGAAWVRCRMCHVSFHEEHYDLLVRILFDANRPAKR